MTTLTGKLINNTYKQLVKIGVSTNTGFTTTLTTIEDGDGSASSLQLATNAAQVDGNLFVAGKFGVSSDASVAGNLAISNKVCASAFYGDGSNLTGIVFTVGTSTTDTLTNKTFGDKVDFNDDVCISGDSVLVGNATIGGTLSVGGAVNMLSTATVSGTAGFLGAVRVSGNASVGGTLDVAGNVSLGGNVTVKGDVHVSSKVCASAFYGDGTNITGIPITGNISVSNAQIGGTLNVSSTATIQGA